MGRLTAVRHFGAYGSIGSTETSDKNAQLDQPHFSIRLRKSLSRNIFVTLPKENPSSAGIIIYMLKYVLKIASAIEWPMHNDVNT